MASIYNRGTIQTIAGSGGSNQKCQFDVDLASVEGSTTNLIATFPNYGSINNYIPDNIGNSFSITNTSEYFITLTVGTNLEQVVSAIISFDSSGPEVPSVTPNAPPPNFKVLVGIIKNGVFIRSVFCNGVWAHVGEAVKVPKEEPAVFEEKNIYYYTWIIEK